jgi:predicted  nucleic acid-binding Zn-ribbon protein
MSDGIEFTGEFVTRPAEDSFRLKKSMKEAQEREKKLIAKLEDAKKHMAALEKALEEAEIRIKTLMEKKATK